MFVNSITTLSKWQDRGLTQFRDNKIICNLSSFPSCTIWKSVEKSRFLQLSFSCSLQKSCTCFKSMLSSSIKLLCSQICLHESGAFLQFSHSLSLAAAAAALPRELESVIFTLKRANFFAMLCAIAISTFTIFKEMFTIYIPENLK